MERNRSITQMTRGLPAPYSGAVWNADEIVDLLAQTLREREAELRREQAFAGLDALQETELHPILAGVADLASWGVLREVTYPAQWRSKKPRRKLLPEDSERQRCDLVLTPKPGQRLADELKNERARVRARELVRGTLFESLATDEPAPVDLSKDVVVPAEDAYWLEVKAVGQFAYVDGVPGPNPAYSSQLTRGVSGDLRKLLADASVRRGGALLVHFTADEAVAKHDLGVLMHRLLDKGLVIRPPATARVGILDRVGNAVCTLVLIEPAGQMDEPPADDSAGEDPLTALA